MSVLKDDSPRILQNFIGGEYVDSIQTSCKYVPVTTPHTGKVIAQCPVSTAEDVEKAVEVAKKAFKTWSARTVKDRVQTLFRFHNLLHTHIDELADLIVLEHGKNKAEAIASIAKGAETVEYATSLPQLIQGKILDVSRGVTCNDTRVPLGVVASIVPFNFPIMVPMWTLPIAIATGNTLILKPSEKVPLTMNRVVALLKEAGVPDGVVNLVNGTVDAVNAICDHPDIKAVTFVGTSHVANLVMERCHKLGKRVLALGGAKNHLIASPDCNVETTSTDVVNSFSGCAGQRCMAASVLLIIGSQPELLERIIAKATALQPGSKAGEVGPVIDKASLDKITSYIEASEQGGANVLVDGRSWTKSHTEGFWIGPTIIFHNNKEDKALHDEIFGPVLSIFQCSNKEEAIEIENNNPYGNAACIYTTTGATAEWFITRFSAAMCGVNIGVPVPREPFSFGGINRSKFGNFVDITGDGGVEFFTWRRKVTTRWGQENLDPKLRM
ncbi:Aldehyde/histidinol dehydrogenase [Glomus cerebriforme]|uniref:methylmalonate-semialdehyde dehydrogenase (CoA acylating) n=1 Tax=Glomus cerebriforme TaxID=658196 RepID=A0A397TP80_9GLOM|nr:Aldehyde/histidinol dehydrogenase [Glomus cerebriforme]